MPEKKNITYTAPIGSIDLRAFDSDGTSFEIHPCADCLPWYAEVVRDPETDEILVREWHAIDCSHFQYLLRDDDDEHAP